MKRCKREGESVNNGGGVVHVDRISDLPEALILQILCLLPAKDAIATSVLSRQWKSHWKMTPQLKFGSFIHRLNIENVCNSLLSHKASVLQSLHLQIHLDKFSAADIGILIGIAFTRNVRELVLGVYLHKGSFTFPRCLFNCETLETLKITVSACLDVPPTVCLKSLKTLKLHCVFKDEESVRILLSGCPKLGDFMVRRNASCTAKTFTIAVPSLQRLSINNGCGKEKSWGYVINAPSLKYFKIKGMKPLESCLMENVPELVEASIVDVSDQIIDDKLMGSLTLVKRLSLTLSPCGSKFPTGRIFYKLVYLELYMNTLVWWDLLTLMLDASPKLQVLKLIDPESWGNRLYHRAEWNQPKNVPECVLLHLETFIWKGYKGKEEEIKVAKYILKNANRLKRATFSSIHIRYHSKDKLQVVNVLKSVAWASSSCHFQFNWEKD